MLTTDLCLSRPSPVPVRTSLSLLVPQNPDLCVVAVVVVVLVWAQ